MLLGEYGVGLSGGSASGIIGGSVKIAVVRQAVIINQH